jgi:ethanolamine utilization protein EutQ (cupin superfamily)
VSLKKIESPVTIEAAGTPRKIISEYVGRVASGTEAVSIAVMQSPRGWSEPGQTPEFDEYTLVLEGELMVESKETTLSVAGGQAVHAPAGEWVRYSTPTSSAHYVAICLAAFSPEIVHRDD